MGWSNTAMAARYQHIIAAATSVGGLLWQSEEQAKPYSDGDGQTDAPAA
jgi:integrase